jgi:hypothetical protein
MERTSDGWRHMARVVLGARMRGDGAQNRNRGERPRSWAPSYIGQWRGEGSGKALMPAVRWSFNVSIIG